MNSKTRKVVFLLFMGLGLVSGASLQQHLFRSLQDNETATSLQGNETTPTGNTTNTTAPVGNETATDAPSVESNATVAPADDGIDSPTNETFVISGAIEGPEVDEDAMETNSSSIVDGDEEPIIEGNHSGNIFDHDDGTEDDSGETSPPMNMTQPPDLQVPNATEAPSGSSTIGMVLAGGIASLTTVLVLC